MIDQTSKILLTVLRGKSLVKAGVYKAAEVSVKDGKTLVKKPMQVIEQPVYDECTQTVHLGHSFIEQCLTRPVKPTKTNYHSWLRSMDGKLHQNWKKLSDNQKIQMNLEELAEVYGGTIKSWELM